MPKLKLIIPILIFSVLLAFTSIIKNQTRVIEKKIYQVNKDILSIKKDLHETQLDFFYVSSPSYLFKKIQHYHQFHFHEQCEHHLPQFPILYVLGLEFEAK